MVVDFVVQVELEEPGLRLEAVVWMDEIVAQKVAQLLVHVLYEKQVCANCPAPVDHETCQ